MAIPKDKPAEEIELTNDQTRVTLITSVSGPSDVGLKHGQVMSRVSLGV